MEPCGTNPKEVYAEIPKYSIILKSPSINAENVVYYNTKYFSSPLLGTLEDKAITTTVTPETATYPRFTSYNKFITIKNLYEDVDYFGGIYVKGNDFLGQGDEKFLAQLLKREGKVVIRTKAKSFLLKEHTIESALCNTTIYIKTDSIYHSAIHLRYNADRKEIWLIRAENGSERMPFFNSYHNLEMFSEALFWNLNEESIEFKFLPSTGSGNTAVFESTNFFEQNRIDKLQGFSRSNPMYTLYEFFRVNNVRKAHIDDIVDFYKYAESDVKSLIFQFVEYGFVDYNMLTNEVIYHEKLGNYLLNENGRKDYDILRFISTVSSQNSNASLSLLNYDLTINGLDLIILMILKLLIFSLPAEKSQYKKIEILPSTAKWRPVYSTFGLVIANSIIIILKLILRLSIPSYYMLKIKVLLLTIWENILYVVYKVTLKMFRERYILINKTINQAVYLSLAILILKVNHPVEFIMIMILFIMVFTIEIDFIIT